MVSHQPVATEAWVRSQGSPYEVCDDEVEFGHIFPMYSIPTLLVSFR
jgi:hypothetical protein